MNRKDILLKENEIRQWVIEHRSKSFICKQLHCKVETLQSYLAKMNIEYKGNQNHQGILDVGYKSAMYYINNNISISSHKLKLKLLKDGIKEHKCELCGNTMWLGKKIPLELHHIDGNHYNNSLSNLKLLCPNCHALEDNNSGAANKKVNEKRLALIEKGYQSKSGRVSTRNIPQNIWKDRLNRILNSNVDFSKYGWKQKVQEVSGLTRHQLDDTIERFPEYLKDKYIRKNK